ncbi:hypothetical protein ACFVH6_21655 [Spirillospora sp. NPDC127200]
MDPALEPPPDAVVHPEVPLPKAELQQLQQVPAATITQQPQPLQRSSPVQQVQQYQQVPQYPQQYAAPNVGSGMTLVMLAAGAMFIMTWRKSKNMRLPLGAALVFGVLIAGSAVGLMVKQTSGVAGNQVEQMVNGIGTGIGGGGGGGNFQQPQPQQQAPAQTP